MKVSLEGRWVEVRKHLVVLLSAVAMTALFFVPTASVAGADTKSEDFSSFTVGPLVVPVGSGWTYTGGAAYDVGIVDSGINGHSLRISNAYTSGSFGDWPISQRLSQPAGEATGYQRFQADFDIASADPSALQSDLRFSLSPQSGGGARMSYLRFEDSTAGVRVFFDDVVNPTGEIGYYPAGETWHDTQIAILNRGVAHHIRFVMSLVPGPHNDVVSVYVDGVLEITGTSWEDYYRFNTESGPMATPPVVDSMIFKAGGTAVLANKDKGFFIDNVSLGSSVAVTTPAPEIAGISPTSGPVGTALTITGTHLAGASVTVGGKAAVITSISDTKIVTSVPSGLAAGAVSVVVTTAGGTDSIGFTVTTTPTPAPTTYTRWLSLQCHHGGSLIAHGYVHGAVAAAYDRVPVRIQRRTADGWRTIGFDRTNSNGWYREIIPDRDGRYRAVALKHTHPDGTIYLRAVSPVHVHH